MNKHGTGSSCSLACLFIDPKLMEVFMRIPHLFLIQLLTLFFALGTIGLSLNKRSNQSCQHIHAFPKWIFLIGKATWSRLFFVTYWLSVDTASDETSEQYLCGLLKIFKPPHRQYRSVWRFLYSAAILRSDGGFFITFLQNKNQKNWRNQKWKNYSEYAQASWP